MRLPKTKDAREGPGTRLLLAYVSSLRMTKSKVWEVKLFSILELPLPSGRGGARGQGVASSNTIELLTHTELSGAKIYHST